MEIMIYVALVTTAMVVLASFAIDVTQNAARSRIIKEVELNAQLTMNRIASEIRHAQAITNVSTTELTLVDVNNNSLILRLNSADNQVEREMGGNTESITAPQVRVTALEFSPIQASGLTKGVSVGISVVQGPANMPPIYQYQTELNTKVFTRQLIY